ncbi:MAG: capsular biosynthesis protein [Clostridiales bacterium]|nr:capsular biosynthesis protein [Clostridiales bacterium]
MRVVIPSAKVVPEELQKIGKLPAIIYPVGEGIVLDYLLEQYEERAESLKVMCYEMADEVERSLSSYRSEKLQLVKLDRLGDLGDTIYAGLEDTHTPVVINFADTIVLDHLPAEYGDSFFYAEDYPSEIWTFFDCLDGRITSIRDKQTGSGAGDRQKLFVGVFQISDEADFKECLRLAAESGQQEMSTFYQALVLYTQQHPMEAVLAENWFDIGHVDKYYNSKLEVQAREFNHITIDKNRGILRKSSDDKEKFIGEILWYLKLPADIEYVRPRIFSYSTSYHDPYVSMEYYSYHTVHELFLYGDLNYHQWRDIFSRIRFIYDDFKRYQVCDTGIQPALKEVYLDKTLKRLDRLRENEQFSAFFHKNMTINRVVYQSLDEICRLLEREIPAQLYDVDAFHIIHGDLCFANIMVDSNFSFIKVIDPRGKFGSYDIYGDQRYELAKLFHSVDGKYDFIIKDLFRLDADAEQVRIDYNILERKRDFDLYEAFLQVFQDEIGESRRKIELIEALLFLSMIPLHGESLEHQYVMLATGIEILDRVLDIRVN